MLPSLGGSIVVYTTSKTITAILSTNCYVGAGGDAHRDGDADTVNGDDNDNGDGGDDGDGGCPWLEAS